jgi:drug/metabolite transporter (DMT)-like permease
LSAVLLHEPIGRRQTVGLGLAVAAVVLIVVG